MLVCESERRCEGSCQDSPQSWMSTSSNMPPSWTVHVSVLWLVVAPQFHRSSPQERGGRVTPSRFTSLCCWMTFRYCGEYILPRSYIKIPHYSFPCTHSWQPQQSFFTAHKGLIHQLLIEIWRNWRLFYNCGEQVGPESCTIESTGVMYEQTLVPS